MSFITTTLQKMSWEKAQDKGKMMTEPADTSEAVRTEVVEALLTHKGNPDNIKPLPTAGATSEAAPALTLERNEILAKLKAGEIEITEASDMLAALSPPPPKNWGPRNTTPLYRRDGELHPIRDENGVSVDKRPFRLCRRDPKKTDMVYVEVCQKAEKGSHGKGVHLMLPHLQALVHEHGCNGILQQALNAYEDGSICYSREKSEKSESEKSESEKSESE
jgi:hypothetical protein